MPFPNKLLSSLDWVFHICEPPSNSILDMLLKAIMDIYLQESDVSTCQVSDVLANDRCERVGVRLSGLVFLLLGRQSILAGSLQVNSGLPIVCKRLVDLIV